MTAAPQMIELRVRLSDGTFDSTITLPTDADSERRTAAIAAWFQCIEQALRLCKARTEPAR